MVGKVLLCLCTSAVQALLVLIDLCTVIYKLFCSQSHADVPASHFLQLRPLAHSRPKYPPPHPIEGQGISDTVEERI